MRDARVARDGFDQRRQLRRAALQEQRLDAPVLVAEVNLEVMHLLAVAHEAKRARLDHARMNRPDGDLVHLFASDLVEGIRVHRGLRFALVADRLQPRMSRDSHPGLLVQLPLEAVQRGPLGGELVIAELSRGVGPGDGERAIRLTEHRGDQRLLVVPLAEERDEARAAAMPAQDVVAPRLRLEERNGLDRDSMGDDGRAHGPSTDVATRCSRSLTTGGM